MKKLFAVINGRVITGLGENTTPTYTRIHFLLNGFKKFEDIEIISIGFQLPSGKGLGGVLFRNAIKSIVALRSTFMLLYHRPFVYFAYPHSLTTVQNRFLFRFCRWMNLDIILDIHDIISQTDAIGDGVSILSEEQESYYINNSSMIIALNRPMWWQIAEKYGVSSSKPVIFLANAFEEDFFRIFPGNYKSQENRFNICYLGGLTKNRGIDLLVAACLTLHEKHPYLKLYLYGLYGEGISPKLRKAIESSEFITQDIILRKDLPSALKDIDLFVMPYDYNISYLNLSSPTKLYEYIGTGKPILCTRCKSLLDLGEDSGITFIDYSIDSMISEIEGLLKDPKMREERAQKISNIRPDHTWNKRAADLYKAIESYSNKNSHENLAEAHL